VDEKLEHRLGVLDRRGFCAAECAPHRCLDRTAARSIDTPTGGGESKMNPATILSIRQSIDQTLASEAR
jgi:hypothetical protein